MSIIDRWYCPQCGSRNIVGGIVAECWQCSTPRPGISAVAYRTPACDKHLSRNDEHECPWCKLDERTKLVQAMMARLTDLLDEDQFGTIESMVLAAGIPYPEQK